MLVNSVALMRLGELGVLAFASSDPSHFTPTTTPCCWVSWGVCCNCVCPSWPVAGQRPIPAGTPPAADPAGRTGGELVAFIEYLRVERQLSPTPAATIRPIWKP